MSTARPPEGAKTPSGGSDPHAVGERGGRLGTRRNLLLAVGCAWLGGTAGAAERATVVPPPGSFRRRS